MLPDFKLRHVFAFLFLAGTTALAAWVVLGTWIPQTDLAQILVGGYFLCAAIGAFWMLVDCVRQRKTPFSHFFLVFVPYGFIFYYLEGARAGTRAVSGSETEKRANPQVPD
jgi:hypothetical protein